MFLETLTDEDLSDVKDETYLKFDDLCIVCIECEEVEVEIED